MSDEIDAYFKDGQAVIDLRYANVSVTPSKTAHVDWLPGKIGVINTSTKYIESQQRMARFLSSPYLPTKVLATLSVLSKVVQEDFNLMFVVFNEKMSNPAAFVHEEDRNFPFFFGVIRGEYVSRMLPLEPKAKAVLQEIRHQLGTK